MPIISGGDSNGGSITLPFTISKAAVAAYMQTDASEEGNLITAVEPGVAGNAITLTMVDNTGTPSIPLSVSVVGSAITVQLGTNGSGVLNSTAAALAAAVNANPDASALVTAGFPEGYTGTAVIPAGFAGTNIFQHGQDELSFTLIDQSGQLRFTLSSPSLLKVGDHAEIAATSGNPNGGYFARGVGGGPTNVEDSFEFDDPDGFTQVGVDNYAYLFIGNPTEPDDAAFDNYRRLRFWFDNTHGAAKLMIKAIDSSGVIATGEIPLT